EGGEHGGVAAGAEAVGEPRATVRLVDHDGQALRGRGEIGRRADVAAVAGDHVDPSLAQKGAHGLQRAGEAPGEAQRRPVRTAREGDLLDGDELEPGGRDEVRLEPLGGAEHDDLGLGAAAADLRGGGQQRGDVSGAAAAGQEDAGRGRGHRVLRERLEAPRRRREAERPEREERPAFAARPAFPRRPAFAGRAAGALSRGAGWTLTERRTEPKRALIASCAPGSRRAKESSRPSAVIEASRAEPPEEMNGRGTPITGSRPVTTIMFTTAWPSSQALMPATVICMK